MRKMKLGLGAGVVALSVFCASLSLGRTPASAPQTQSAAGFAIKGDVEHPLSFTIEELEKLPHREFRLKDHAGTEATYSGVPLRELLINAGVPLGNHRMRGKNLSKYLLAEAADGYRVVFALPEFDAEFAERNIMVADRRDGKPLDDHEGPLRMIVPQEALQARWVRQLKSVSVLKVPD